MRNHNGTPDIDPSKHELLIHGMVRQPLIFTVDSLMRYPMRTEIHFMECAGNSGGISGRGDAATGDRGRHAWPALRFGMDRREALHTAGRSGS